MDSRPVFVLITAKTCPGCVAFKKNTWDSLRDQLEKDNKVQIVTVEVPTTTSKPDPVKYHKDLSRFIGWFPTMILFPSSRWNNHNSELIGIVKNGKLVPPGTNNDDKFIPEHVEMVGKIDLSKEDVLKWVDYTINNVDMFNRNESIILTNQNPSQIINKQLPGGKLRVPTAVRYEQFQSSKVK